MIHLHDIVNADDLEAAVDSGLVKRRDHDGLTIWNYTAAAMWTPGAWDNPAVRHCRGLITDSAGNIVARPWSKFFNHGQAEAGQLDMDAPVEVTDKLDGSLGIIHQRPGGMWAVATRGSFESGQAKHATDILRRYMFDEAAAARWTLLVEIVYPENRIVCDYGDRDELVLLGAVYNATGSTIGPNDAADLTGWDGPVAETFPYETLREALQAPPRPGMEGLVVRYMNETQRLVKIKQADYVELHRIVTGLSERTVWQHMVDGKPLTELLEPLPDELHGWTRSVWMDLDNAADDALEEAHHWFDVVSASLPVGWQRRDFAQAVQADVPAHFRPYLFQLLDDRDPTPSILKNLKPFGDLRAKTITEDVA